MKSSYILRPYIDMIYLTDIIVNTKSQLHFPAFVVVASRATEYSAAIRKEEDGPMCGKRMNQVTGQDRELDTTFHSL